MQQAAAQAGALGVPQPCLLVSAAGLPGCLEEPHTEAAAHPKLLQPTQLHRTDCAAAAGRAGERGCQLEGAAGHQLAVVRAVV